MPNSDNQHGVFNKETVIYSRAAENDDATFNNVDEAKAHLLSAAALTVIDECATQVQWELVGNTGLKVTYAFGTKGTGTAEADDWTAGVRAQRTSGSKVEHLARLKEELEREKAAERRDPRHPSCPRRRCASARAPAAP